MPKWLRDEIGPPPRRNTVSVEDIEREFELRSDAELLDALTQFGELMLGEVTNRTNMLDSKALSLLGWTAALLAIWVGTWEATPFPHVELIVVTVGAIAAAVALLASSSALRVRRWRWPSQRDWFCLAVFDRPSLLRRSHIVSMLETYEGHCAENDVKTHRVKVAQLGLAVAGTCLSMQLVLRVVAQVR